MNKLSILKRNDGFTIRSMGDETLFLNQNGTAIHVADEVGSFIYQKIDGKAALADILDAILETYEVDEKTAETDLFDFVEHMVRQNILEPLE